jgi:DNA-binding NtrC family response regulator
MNDILIVVENAELRKSISRSMLLAGYRIAEESSYKSGLKKFKQTSFDVVIFEFESQNTSGLDLLKKIKRINPRTSLIAIVKKASGANIATAISEGAHAALQIPFDMEELQIQVKKTLDHTNLIQEVAYLRHARPNVVYNFDNIITKSEKIREIFSVLQKIAQTDTSVIIYGEPGTGKELIAGAIHYNSLRKENNFIKVNCAALPENLLESELFGHEPGAFPGADKQRVGRFEQANRGTIFLEEISLLTLQTQTKLLKFINKKEIKRLGASQTIKIDVRLILATKRNLKEEISAGRFRDDLFWQLHVVPIEIPPLRQRKCDILILAEYFLKYYNKELNKYITGFDTDAEKAMLEYQWPGNVRELKKAVEWAVLRANNEKISLKDLSFPLAGAHSADGPGFEKNGLSLFEVEKNTVLKALEAADWVQKDAAKLLGISKRALNYKIENFQIKNPKWIKNK